MQTEFQIIFSWKRGFSMLLLTLFSFSVALAQVPVKGTVIDQTGESVPGASIQVKGSTQGTITDFDGNFSLNVPDKKSVLVISFIGYATQEVQVDPSKPMSIKLQEDTKTLEEVVVVGYQEVKRKDLTGSVAKVDMEGLLKTPASSFDQTLGGRIAGVNVSSGEGGPGGTMNIVIRGNNSLTQDNSPLYVIDGFPVEDPAIASTINPSDTESIEVLKDASATAIYGARGANGVVIITTKKGKIGKPQMKYEGSFGVQKISNTIPMMDAYEFVKLQNELYPKDTKDNYLIEHEGKQWTLDDYRHTPQYDWQDEIFRTAWQQNHSVSLMGGSEGVRYNASASYFDQDGVILCSNYKRFQTRMNTVVRRDKLNMSLTANYSRSIQTGSSTSLYSSSGMNNLFYSVWGYRPVTEPDVPLNTLMDNAMDASVEPTNDYRFNPIMSLKNEYRKYYINNLQINGFVEYEFMKGLKLKVSGGYTYDARNTDTFNNSKTRYGSPISTDKVNAQIVRQQRLTWLNENVLTYQTNIKRKHFFNSLLGVTLQNSDYETYSFKTTQIPNESMGMAGMNEGVPGATNSEKSSWSMMSYLGSLKYNYGSKYYATVSFRVDGSSKFSKDNRYGFFPSGSLAWSFTEENFMKRFRNVISSGKLRASWGLTGNNRVGEYEAYALLRMLKTGSANLSSGVYPFDNNMNSIGMVPVSLSNKDLKWETTEQWNVGVDLGFLDERIGVTFDWYFKTTDDLLLDAQLPRSSGYYSVMKNIGKVRNTGVEFTLNTLNMDRNGFKWRTNFNIAFNKNKVLELAENQNSLLTAAYFDQTYNSQPTYIAKKGYSMGMMYGYQFEGTYKYDDFYQSGDTYVLRPGVPHFSGENNTQPGMPKYKDLNGDGVIDTNDRTMIGRGLPIHTGGFTNDFEYKGFDLSIFFQWSYGNDILNANRLFFENVNNSRNLNQYASYANRWTPENPMSDIPVAKNSSSNKVVSSRVVEDGSFLRLKTVTLGYTLPKKWILKTGITNARLYVAAQNLWTLTDYSGYDPEVSIRNSALTPGLDYSAYPRAFAINFGVSLGF
ncbi:TonB-dependent receptor plug domain protein [gut metagenome]|uniref:TonB-dependent receptor plug domain protein n=1 Tax=gut metagenome TaxID=749906 RepID=J9H889_9ZZZZ